MEESVMQIANIESAIEAILYAAGYPVKYEKLSEVLGLDVKDVKTMVEHMAIQYNKEDSTRGINLLMFEETCQFCTKEQYAPYIREALGIRRGGNLSASSLEVLAVVAYNQPVTRAYVDTVRGVDSSYAMNSLIDKGLIEACGRLDAPGRPMIYATTEKFLRVFGINSLEDLPQTESLEEIAKNEAEGVITMDIAKDTPAEASHNEIDSDEEKFENPAV
jgi:segregation and condensation protein B